MHQPVRGRGVLGLARRRSPDRGAVGIRRSRPVGVDLPVGRRLGRDAGPPGRARRAGAGGRRVRAVGALGACPAGARWVGAGDMAGNAMEWVADWYSAAYYKQEV